MYAQIDAAVCEHKAAKRISLCTHTSDCRGGVRGRLLLPSVLLGAAYSIIIVVVGIVITMFSSSGGWVKLRVTTPFRASPRTPSCTNFL